MKRYRFRTATLRSLWRDLPLKAETDAIAVGQAVLDRHSGAFVWRVPGEIEEGEDGRSVRGD